MTPELIRAAVDLADALARENEALLALDLPRAMSLLESKHRATDDMLAASSAVAAGAGGLEDARVAEQLGERLRALAEENRRLLERAIAVQGHVIGALMRSASGRPGPAPRYGSGGLLTVTRAAPMTLSARA